MVTYCCAFNCNEKSNQNKYTFHKFPKDPLMHKKWCLAIRRKNFVPRSHTSICSKHFENHCFVKRFGSISNYLKDDAVPTIFDYRPKKTKNPLVVKLHSEKWNEQKSTDEDLPSDSSSIPETPQVSSHNLSTHLSSITNNTKSKDINLTIYVNKIYCCSGKSDVSNSKPNNFSSDESVTMENSSLLPEKNNSNSSVFKMELDLKDLKEKGTSTSGNIDKCAISTLTNSVLAETEEPHHMISESVSTPSGSFVDNNDILTGTVKVTMHVKKYNFSNTPGRDVKRNSCTSTYTLCDNSNKKTSTEQCSNMDNLKDGVLFSTDASIPTDVPQDSIFQEQSIENFTVSDMEDSNKAKIFFHLAKSRILNLEKRMQT